MLVVGIPIVKLRPTWIISQGRGPLGETTAIQVASRRDEALARVRARAHLNRTEFIATSISIWSARGESWIDAQAAKVCGC